MNKLTISLIVLVGILFLGIGVLMKPTSFTSLTITSNSDVASRTYSNKLVPKEIIMIGSAFIITGVIGLSILGFISARDSKQSNQNTTLSN